MNLTGAPFTLLVGDVRDRLAELEPDSIHCVITSPPYWALRDYGVDGQLGLEPTPDCLGWATGDPCGCCFVCHLVDVFRHVRRVLRPDGTVWLNLGDSYASKTRGSDEGWDKSRLTNPGTVQKMQAAALRSTGERHRGKDAGLKEKDLVGVPWRVAFALQADGWWLRRDNIWAKRNPMPESTQDRTTSAHEYLFLLAKSPRYFYDADAIREPAEWARWGDQTVPKHNGTATRAGWIKPRTKDDLLRMAGGRGKQGEAAAAAAAAAGNDASARRYDGFNARWDATGDIRARNKRSVWEVALELEQTAAELADLFLDAIATGEHELAHTVWSIATEPYAAAHFATFPTRLVEPCVLAGTSARGVCPDCGAPWERMTDIDYAPSPRHGLPRLDRLTSTSGWRPTCGCYDHLYRAAMPRPRPSKRWQNLTWWTRARARPGHPSWPTVPATVLDPFLGSGTTALVARRHGRASVGVELSPEYARLAERRVERWWRRSNTPRTTPAADDPQLTIDVT